MNTANIDQNSPLSNLDTAVDRLLEALTTVADLDGLIEGLRGYEPFLALLRPDAEGAVDALAIAAVWGQLANVAGEVLALRKGVADGDQA